MSGVKDLALLPKNMEKIIPSYRGRLRANPEQSWGWNLGIPSFLLLQHCAKTWTKHSGNSGEPKWAASPCPWNVFLSFHGQGCILQFSSTKKWNVLGKFGAHRKLCKIKKPQATGSYQYLSKLKKVMGGKKKKIQSHSKMPFQKFHLPRLIEFTHTLFYLWEITDKNKRQSWNWTWNLLQWTKKVFVETIYLKLWVKKRFKTTSFPWKGHTGVKLLGLCRKHKNGDKEHGITGIFWLKGDNILCALYTQNKLQVQLFQSQFDLPLSPLCVQFVKTKYIKGFVHILQCWLILWKTQTGSKMCPWNPKCLQRTLSPDLLQNFQFLLPQPIFFFFFQKYHLKLLIWVLKLLFSVRNHQDAAGAFQGHSWGLLVDPLDSVPVTATGSSKSTP